MAKRKNHRKWLWRGIGLILVALLVVAGFLIWQNNFNSNGEETVGLDDNNVEVVKQNKNGSEIKENENQTKEETEEKKVVQYEGEDPNNNSELSGVITYAGVNEGVLMIRVNIDQYLNSGSCELVLDKNGTSVYKYTANITDSASTSTCEGFDVPVDKLGRGKIGIKINLKSGNKKGVINGEVDV